MLGDARRAAPGSPRSQRGLPSRRIGEVVRAAKPIRTDPVVVYVAPGSGPTRAAFAARRTVGGAVARNRARRLLREAWRRVADRTRDGHDVVLMARAPIEGTKAQDVTREVEQALARAGILR